MLLVLVQANCTCLSEGGERERERERELSENIFFVRVMLSWDMSFIHHALSSIM